MRGRRPPSKQSNYIIFQSLYKIAILLYKLSPLFASFFNKFSHKIVLSSSKVSSSNGFYCIYDILNTFFSNATRSIMEVLIHKHFLC